MTGIWRIRDRRTFALVRAHGTRRRSGALTVTAVLQPDGPHPPQVAFAIGRRVGSAVVRNRLRRQLRAAVRDLGPAPGEYLISVAPAAGELSFAELRSDLATAMGALGALPQ